MLSFVSVEFQNQSFDRCGCDLALYVTRTLDLSNLNTCRRTQRSSEVSKVKYVPYFGTSQQSLEAIRVYTNTSRNSVVAVPTDFTDVTTAAG